LREPDANQVMAGMKTVLEFRDIFKEEQGNYLVHGMKKRYMGMW